MKTLVENQTAVDLIEGLQYAPGYISAVEATHLLAAIDGPLVVCQRY